MLHASKKKCVMPCVVHNRVEGLWELLQLFERQYCFSERPPINWVHPQNRKRTGYWLHSTPKWALWFSAVSRQVSEQCAANKKHFINIPSAVSPLLVNILAPNKILRSGNDVAQRLLPCSLDGVELNGLPLPCHIVDRRVMGFCEILCIFFFFFNQDFVTWSGSWYLHAKPG